MFHWFPLRTWKWPWKVLPSLAMGLQNGWLLEKRLYQNGWSTSHQPIPAIQWWYDWNLIMNHQSTKTDQPVVAWISTYSYLAMAQNHWPPKKYSWSMLKFRKKIFKKKLVTSGSIGHQKLWRISPRHQLLKSSFVVSDLPRMDPNAQSDWSWSQFPMGRMQKWLFEFSPTLPLQFSSWVLLILAFSTSTWSLGSAEKPSMSTTINFFKGESSEALKTNTSCQHHFEHEVTWIVEKHPNFVGKCWKLSGSIGGLVKLSIHVHPIGQVSREDFREAPARCPMADTAPTAPETAPGGFWMGKPIVWGPDILRNIYIVTYSNPHK